MAMTTDNNFLSNATSLLEKSGIGNWIIKPLSPDNHGVKVYEI
jgi:hypothetical protein